MKAPTRKTDLPISRIWRGSRIVALSAVVFLPAAAGSTPLHRAGDAAMTRGMAVATPFYGLCYGQYRDGQSPNLGVHPSREEIAEDLRRLLPLTSRLRLYGLHRSGRVVVEEAARLGFEVLAGVWLGRDPVANEREIEEAVRLARELPDAVEALIVGSEVLLRGDMDPESLLAIIRRMRAETGLPIAYAETAKDWLSGDPAVDAIGREVDILLAHIYPFWDGVSIEAAPAHYEQKLAELRQRFPEADLRIGETGWPVAGEPMDQAVPSAENQAIWLDYILGRSAQDRVYYFSAFSEAWKEGEEGGGVGPEWGTSDSRGRLRPRVAEVFDRRGLDTMGLSFDRSPRSQDIGDTPLALWGHFNRADYQSTIDVALRIIERDLGDAQRQEAESGGDQVDAVGLAYFLMGQSFEMLGEIAAARRAYRTVIEQFRWSRANDGDTRWYVADAAREREARLPRSDRDPNR